MMCCAVHAALSLPMLCIDGCMDAVLANDMMHRAGWSDPVEAQSKNLSQHQTEGVLMHDTSMAMHDTSMAMRNS
eukprot:591678-Rhodomonas_salina.2